MIWIDNIIVSDEVTEKNFVCNLKKCKGACCVEGDFGAPLDEDELSTLEEVYPLVEPYMSEIGKETVKQKGYYTFNEQPQEFGTSLNPDESCAFLFVEGETGISYCSIEKAWKEGKIAWRKPISCHLYPIRIEKMGDMDALNYDKWDICKDACTLGDELKVPVYQFAKEAIVRKYGKDLYEQLDATVKHEKDSD